MEPWVQQIVVPLAVAVVLQYLPHELVVHYFVET